MNNPLENYKQVEILYKKVENEQVGILGFNLGQPT